MKQKALVESLEDRCLLSASLTAADVAQIISQAAAVSLPSQTIVVVDINGDVLGIYGQAPPVTNQQASPDNLAELERVNKAGVLTGALGPNTAAKFALINATAEARTAAAFESTEDAFSTRTARFIVQNDFPQPIANTEAGPLLGTEFSADAGTDVLPVGDGTGLAAGLSGNPGGMPLYIDGQPVGGIGVAGSGQVVAARQDLVAQAAPGLPLDQQSPAFQSDPNGTFYNGNEEYNFDEAVAEAGEIGFTPAPAIEATNILVNGLTFPYVAEGPASGPPPAGVPGLTDNGELLSALPPRTYFVYKPFGANVAGPINAPPSPYPTTPLQETNGTPLTGILKNNSPLAGGLGPDPNLDFTNDNSMIPSVSSTGAVTWTPGNFGFIPGDVVNGTKLTKNNLLQIVEQALTEALSIRGAIRVPSDVPAEVHVAVTDTNGDILTVVATPDATNFSFDIAVQKARTSAFFSDDTHAFSSRAIGFLSDSLLPPSVENGVTGPLYQLQESLALPQNEEAFLPDITEDINGVPTVVPNPLGNGITIFPGGAPLYKNGHLVGAIGISGDGVDQDDLIAFAGTAGFRPPTSIEDDELSAPDIVSFLTQKIQEIAYVPPLGDPHYDLRTISFLQNAVGFVDPDAVVGNRDNITLSPTDTITDRILKRLAAVGIDGIQLPYQKFPRNPGL